MRLARTHHRAPQAQAGYALILTVMIIILLTAILMPLLFEVQRESQVTSNARAMRHMELAALGALQEAYDVLADDFPAEDASAGAAAQGSMPGIGGVEAQGTATAGSGEGEEEEPAHDSMNSQALIYHRRALQREEGLGLDERIPDWVIAESANSESYERDDMRVKTYVYIEDENRKYNLLNLAHPQQEFADQALEQVERLLNWVREDRLDGGLDADFDPRLVARAFQEWMKTDLNRAVDGELYQRPLLLSNAKKNGENDATDKTTLPVSLDELRLAVTDRVRLPESVWVDQLDDNTPPEVHPGLVSLLTVYTSLREEPITEDLEGRYIPDEDEQTAGRPRANSSRSTTPEASSTTVQPPTAAPDVVAMININTAPRAVLLAVAPPDLIPPDVIDEILEYRSEIDEEKVRKQEEEQAEASEFNTTKSRTDVMTGMEGDERPPLQTFSALEVLEDKIESFKALDDKAKGEFLKYFTVNSEVFSVYVTVICNPNETQDERDATRFLSGAAGDSAQDLSRRYLDVKIGEIVRRYRSVVWRRAATEGDEPVEFAPIVRFEERFERKLAFWENPSKVAW